MKTKIKNAKNLFITGVLIISTLNSCDKYLDIVPDNAPVIDQAFNMRTMAERYLATCYNALPANFTLGSNPGLLSGDEFWLNSVNNYSAGNYPAWHLAMGTQNGDSPLINNWDGNNGGKNIWQGISNCNIFLNRIQGVPDMTETEIKQWAAEARVLKAYYHFLLLRQYGPIPIMDEYIPVDAEPGSYNFSRMPVDEIFNYIGTTITEAIPDLIEDITNIQQETGRITQVAAKAIKAEILIFAASPLFNGNQGIEANLKDKQGKALFNSTFDLQKWKTAADALSEAISFAESHNKKLHTWKIPGNLSTEPHESTIFQMNYREAFSENIDNQESLWYDTRSIANGTVQGLFSPPRYDGQSNNHTNLAGSMSVTLNAVERFYSKNGVPIEEDIEYPYSKRYELISVVSDENNKTSLQAGYRTVRLHLDREPRFYGAVAFDGGRMFMLINTSDEKAYNINYKLNGNVGKVDPTRYNITGYASKKHVNYQNTTGANNAFTARSYAYPIIRLANLYLYYAEALNELQGPSEEVYRLIDLVRERSGLKGVKESWANYSSNPSKPNTKEGLRAIIKSERSIEFAFEGKRFWDLLRWKDAVSELNTTIYGWDINQSDANSFYRLTPLFNRTFAEREYLWPISLNERRRNPELVQNIGW